MRLDRFLEQEWLPAIATSIRPTTFYGYGSHVRRHIIPALGRVPLEALDPRKLNAFYSELLASGRSDGRGGLSPNTVRRVHATLHRALRDAVRWGYLPSNPADRADPPKLRFGGQHELATWDRDQLRAFLRFVRDDKLYPLWFLLATTGMRRGEALGLRWKDVDLDGGALAVRQTIVTVGGEIICSTPKTARGRRVVALDEASVDVLRRYRTRTKGTDLIFVRADGGPLRPNGVSKRFNRLVAGAGLPRIRLHDLRHTHATLALQAGIHPKIVSERLGHATVAITLDVYSHSLAHLQKEAAELVGKLIAG